MARAGTQRAGRARIDVPSQSTSAAKLAYPLAIAAMWAFIYVVFMRPAAEKERRVAAAHEEALRRAAAVADAAAGAPQGH